MNLRSAAFYLVIVVSAVTCFASSDADSGSRQLTLTFFGSHTCHECMQIDAKLLSPLKNAHPGKLDVEFVETESDTGLEKMLQFEKRRGITIDAAQMLFFPDTFLSGYDDIMRLGKSMIERRLENMPVSAADTLAGKVDLEKTLKGKAYSWKFFIGTLVTGLADGVNPCAIATMIFLISFLATRKRKRGEVLLIGLTYTATVFFTYLAMGLGLKGVLEHISGYHMISQIIRWSAFIVAVVIALLSFKDAFTYHTTGKADQITLQLPKTVKIRIHKIISGNLSGRSLVVGSIITGFLVTLLEAICTGQMYIPYIVVMTQQATLKVTGYIYLVFYNFLFILPLLIVMVLAYFGLKWNDLARQTQKRMVLLKVLLGIIMAGLAVYLAVGSGFIS